MTHVGDKGGVVVAPPQQVQFCTASQNISGTFLSFAGFDTIKIKIPWAAASPRTEALELFDKDGVSGGIKSRFTRLEALEAPSWSGSFGLKVEQDGSRNFLLIEGSPAKAGTGQNLYLPRESVIEVLTKVLTKKEWVNELATLTGEDSDVIQSALRSGLQMAKVLRIDLTYHALAEDEGHLAEIFRALDQGRAGRWSAKGVVHRFARLGEHSLSIRSRRIGLKAYSKLHEMVVAGRCPRLNECPTLYDEAQGVVRFEFSLRSEALKDEEKFAACWTSGYLESVADKLQTMIAWPGEPRGSRRRWYRVRLRGEKDLLGIRDEIAKALYTNKVISVNQLSMSGLGELFDGLKSVVSKADNGSVVVEKMCEIEEVLAMRKIDKQWFNLWLQGVDVWAEMSNPATAKRIRNNIKKATGHDIKARYTGINFEPVQPVAVQLKPWVPARNWYDLIAA